MRDNYHGQQVLSAIDPIVDDSNDNIADGNTIDLQGFNSCLLVAEVGEPGDTYSGSVRTEFFVEHAEDDGDGSPDSWEKVPDDQVLNSVASGVSNQTGTFGIVDANGEVPAVFATGYIGGRRFVRVQQNNVGTHANGTPTSAVAVLGNPSFTPNS